MREILLVEDSDDDAQFLQRALKEASVANPVRHLTDGAAALDYLKAQVDKPAEMPSILLVDLKLPGASGFEILTFLQSNALFSKMLKVVVSDLRTMEDIKKVYAVGAQSFLGKPIHAQDLAELIKTYPDYWLLK
jgi:CheY-like chemotaxis protein